jgi:hypothetical protein
MTFRIIIPTRGRVNNQLTLSQFPRELRELTTIICPKKEHFAISGMDTGEEVLAQPESVTTIARKRAWIMQDLCKERGWDKILMLDDDLRFATRISEGDWHLREVKGKELIPDIERIRDKLGDEFPHVGFGVRQGNNRLTEVGWKTPGKMCYSLGYYLPVVLKEAHPFILETREDMILSLQLLLKGYPNAIWNTTVVDQKEFGGTGGAAIERTMERSNDDAEKFAQLFPGYVSVVQKAYKSSIPRKEVMVQWVKALENGRRIRATTENIGLNTSDPTIPSENNNAG